VRRDFFVTLFYTHAKRDELPSSGWPVLFAAYEVVCTSVLRHPAYVRHITHNSFFLSLTLLMAGPRLPL
jgi:hypothetical protein